MAIAVKKYVTIDRKFFCAYPILLDFFPFFLISCPVLSEQIFFGHNSAQSPPNFNFSIFFMTSKLFSLFNKNIKQLWLILLKQLLHIWLRSKFHVRKPSTFLIGSFVIELSFLSQLNTFPEIWIIIKSVENKRKIFGQC